MVRLRFEMLMALSERCTWKRRSYSAVAESGERPRKAAKRRQLRMWPFCVDVESLRALMSSIMRWRNGVIVFVAMGSSFLR